MNDIESRNLAWSSQPADRERDKARSEEEREGRQNPAWDQWEFPTASRSRSTSAAQTPCHGFRFPIGPTRTLFTADSWPSVALTGAAERQGARSCWAGTPAARKRTGLRHNALNHLHRRELAPRKSSQGAETARQSQSSMEVSLSMSYVGSPEFKPWDDTIDTTIVAIAVGDTSHTDRERVWGSLVWIVHPKQGKHTLSKVCSTFNLGKTRL